MEQKNTKETFYFKKGFLQVLDHFLNRSTLQYGIDKRYVDPLLGECNPYIVFLEDLKTIESTFMPVIYVDIDENTEARRTIFGGLKVRRKHEYRSGIKTTSTFSRKEYEIIRNFFNSV